MDLLTASGQGLVADIDCSDWSYTVHRGRTRKCRVLICRFSAADVRAPSSISVAR